MYAPLPNRATRAIVVDPLGEPQIFENAEVKVGKKGVTVTHASGPYDWETEQWPGDIKVKIPVEEILEVLLAIQID